MNLLRTSTEMTYSPISEILFMISIDSWRVSQSERLRFGKGKHHREAKFGLGDDFCFVFGQKCTIRLKCNGARCTNFLHINPAHYDELNHVHSRNWLIVSKVFWFTVMFSTVFEENDEHHLNFLPTLTWFSRFCFIFGSLFARLLDSFEVIFINARLVTSSDTFDECRFSSYVDLLRSLFDVPFAVNSYLWVWVSVWRRCAEYNSQVSLSFVWLYYLIF